MGAVPEQVLNKKKHRDLAILVMKLLQALASLKPW